MTVGQEVLLQAEQHPSGALKAIDCNGITVRYSDQGTGQPFLFLHHGGASHAVWSDLRERLWEKGRTIAIDFPGFGESDKPRRSPNSNELFRYDLPMLTETVDQVIRSLELERPILVGNCMGSAAALAYTLNFPDRVGGLLLCNVLTQATVETGALRKLLRIGGSIPGMRWLLARHYEWGAMPAPFQKWSINLQLSPGQQLSENLQETFEHLYRQPCQNRVLNNMGVYLPTFGKLDHVQKPAALPPVWVVWGKHNRILPCAQGRAFCERFGVDRLEVLETGHLPMVQCPEVVANLLCQLSAQVNPPADVPPRSLPPHSLRELAQRSPAATAVIEAPSARRPERSVDWQTLWQMANQLAWELQNAGVGSADRVLLLVTPSPEFLALSHALNMIGAAVVFVDGGLPPAAMASCIRQAQPTAFIGIPRAHLLRLIMPWALSSVRRYFSLASDPALASTKLLSPVGGKLDVPFPAVEPSPDSLAAIVFTSGSTGPPKGVELSFRNFSAMLARSTEPLGEQYGDTALILYPLFLQIFSLMGRTSVLPDMDFSRPTAADPEDIVKCMQRYKTTLGFSSPAILVRVAAYCKQHEISLDTMRVFFAAGAPIAYRQVIEPITSVMPNGHVVTPYGATEALPVAAIDSEEIRSNTAALTDRGAGICVGKPIEQVQVRIIPIDDGVLSTMETVDEMPRGQVGEICVAGENVTLRYFDAPAQTTAAKIPDPHVPGGCWHRIGDLGYLDDQGRLWYCGRKKHRVECPDRTFFAQQPEGVADAVPGVFRSAFVGVKINGRITPALVVEPEEKPPRSWDVLAQSIQNELSAQGFPISRAHILLHVAPFPVDPRHNAKIHREQLADWASEQLGLNVSRGGLAWLQRRRGTSSSWG